MRGGDPFKLLECLPLQAYPAGTDGSSSGEVDCQPKGSPASPETIAVVLQEGGLETHLLSADELADPLVLNTSRFDLLVLPTGQTSRVQFAS